MFHRGRILCFTIGKLGEGGVRERGSLISYKINRNLIDI